jgi:hypothetical protein
MRLKAIFNNLTKITYRYWIKLLGFTLLLSLFALNAEATPVQVFHQCLVQSQCESQTENAPAWMKCCKACLGKTHFGQQAFLHDLMHAHLNLVCTQLQNNTYSQKITSNQQAKHLFMIGSYMHYYGKGGCNQDELIWSAPLTLRHTTGDRIVGGTDQQRGLIRIYPIARCPNAYLSEMLSVADLDVIAQGSHDAQGDHIKLDFYPPASDKGIAVDAANEHLINVITSLASKSKDNLNGQLNDFTLTPKQLFIGNHLTFLLKAAKPKQGWEGSTHLFIESAQAKNKVVSTKTVLPSTQRKESA